jgi:hypothetical protein
MQLSNMQPFFISDGGEIYIVNEDAKSSKPWYFCNFHENIYEQPADLALELKMLRGDYFWRSAAQNFFSEAKAQDFLVKQSAANSGMFGIA